MKERLIEMIADKVHPFMRDGDPHARPAALKLAAEILELTVEHIDCETYKHYGYFCGYGSDDRKS